MVEQNDWRLMGQEKWLAKKTLSWRQYKASTPTWDHDHCVFCTAKFREGGDLVTLHEGWVTSDGNHWVCAACFEDFKEMFALVTGSSGTNMSSSR